LSPAGETGTGAGHRLKKGASSRQEARPQNIRQLKFMFLGDEGIDGIVSADKFGFDSIYVQAKRWKQDNTVGEPEIQKFLGALSGQGATKGIFITTSQFSKKAVSFAQKILHSKIVLVDGKQLTNLMIEYNLGVSTVATYNVKRLDSDFFEDNM